MDRLVLYMTCPPDFFQSASHRVYIPSNLKHVRTFTLGRSLMKSFVLGCLLAVLCTMASAQTNVSGTISKDSTWTLSASPYVVTGNVIVNTAWTLTVDSGVVVRFQGNTSLIVYGSIAARHVVFTSAKDTAGGSPSRGDWNSIQIGDYSTAGDGSFDTCAIKYGGTNSFPSDAANVFVYGGTATFTGCDISFSENYGVMFAGGSAAVNVSFTGSSVFSCDWPLSYRGTSALSLNGTNVLTGNTHNGISLRYSEQSDALTLPAASVPYYFPGNFNVRAAGSMTIASGNICKFAQYSSLNVEGVLHAVAAEGEDITITAYTDDNAGGDTNADATATTPASSYWGGVLFQNSSVDSSCVMRRSHVRFAGAYRIGGISMYNASPTVDSCDLANNFFGVMMQSVSNPVFSNNVIGSSELVPIAISFAANPVLSNNAFSFSDNRYDAIGLLGGTLPANATLPIRSITNIDNVSYLLLEDVVVPVGRVLTIHERVVIKAINDNTYEYGSPRMTIQGKLIASASSDSTSIVFTSARDDNFGDPFDTNKDGTSTAPQSGDWGGIVFEGSSDDSSVMNFCKMKYGRLPGTYYNTRYIGDGAITMVNASPTISNCEIKDVVYGIYAFQSSNPKILNTTFVNTQYTPVAMSISADPTFSGNIFTNVAWRALGIIGENLGFSGTIRKRDVAGFANITYVLLEDVTVNSGTEVTVDPGVVIKMNNSGFFINGGFRAKGTVAGGMVVFTSLKDDNVGNPQDSNGDGSSTAPAKGDWKTIQYQGTSNDGFALLDSCTIQYGGNYGSNFGNVTYVDAGGVFSNSLSTDSYQYGLSCDGGSQPTITGVDIRNSRLDPIAMSLKADPIFTNITFAANRSNGIKILEGSLSSNARLRKRSVAGFPNIAYIVEYLTVGQNAILTIDPGVIIKFPAGYYQRYITVEGGLKAEGSAAQHITFTSLNDDYAGDTNNDGNTATPSRGDWYTIAFTPTSNDTANVLRNCDILYGGQNGSWDPSYKDYGMVQVNSSHVVIDSCYFQQSAKTAIGVYGSADPIITNCQISNVELMPVSMSMFSNPVFANNLALNVGYMALGIVPETYAVNATIPMRNFGGYTNITYMLMTGAYSIVPTVNSGTTITVPAGVVFKYWPIGAGGNRFQVNGSLVVAGTPGSPVVFTDPRDDAYGNPMDSNGDGFLTVPEIVSCPGISFADVSDDSLSSIKYAMIRYFDTGISLQQASPAIEHCTFVRNNWGVLLNGVSSPSLDSCAFVDLEYAPMLISLVSYPRSTPGNTIAGSTYRGIGVVDETLAQDITLQKRNFAGITNIPYAFDHYTVGTGAVMTVQPGVILKFRPGGWLSVKKGLMALGGNHPDSTIVFTDLHDDYYGGDTNADSSDTNPDVQYGYSNWNGLVFEGEALDPLCQMDHTVVRYATYYWSSTASGIRVNNASPTIMHSVLSKNKVGLSIIGSSNPIIQYSDIYENWEFGVNYPSPVFSVDARWNWWGSNTGPTHSSNPAGSGDDISSGINYTPYLTTGSGNPIAGDVSLNGRVQAFDASLILKYSVNPHGVDSLSARQIQVGDVSGNGGPDTAAVTPYDASLVLQYVVGLVGAFPVEVNRIAHPDALKDQPYAVEKQVSASLTLGSSAAKRGVRVTIPMEIADVSGVASIQAIVRFDPDVLTVDNVAPSGIGTGLNFTSFIDKGEIRLAFAGDRILETGGRLAELSFQVSEEVRGKVSTPVTITHVLANEQNLTARAVGGTIDVTGKPESFALFQNYPNPFNPTTTISFQVPDDRSRIRVVIFNLLGQQVRTLEDGVRDAGVHKMVWDGRNDAGVAQPSGVYLCQLRSGSFVQTRKLTMMK